MLVPYKYHAVSDPFVVHSHVDNYRKIKIFLIRYFAKEFRVRLPVYQLYEESVLNLSKIIEERHIKTYGQVIFTICPKEPVGYIAYILPFKIIRVIVLHIDRR